MKVLLLNIDSKLPNIALKKIEMWHKGRGDEVIWDMPMMLGQTNKAYASCIFTKNASAIANYKGLNLELIAGGTGYDLTIKLPSEIEQMKPKINYGFTTRGCIRKCAFCFVPQSEGYIRAVGDIYDIWDGEGGEVVLLDNNILALPKHFRMICEQAMEENITLDFNQGLDIRLVTPSICELLRDTKLKRIRFAFDSPKLETTIRNKVAMLRDYSVKDAFPFYVLVGFDTTFEEDMHRLEVLKELGCRAYVMRHENTPKERRYIRMAQWANQFWTFAKYDYRAFCVEFEASQANRQ